MLDTNHEPPEQAPRQPPQAAADSAAAGPVCPVPLSDYPQVLLAHGGGGKLMDQLIHRVFMPAFRNPTLDACHDGARLAIGSARLALTTDSYVVRPLFFPGSDIGALAVNGTVNDLAMCGARPLYLTAAFILEEGLPMETLVRVVESMRRAAAAAGVQIVTGDTKVVDQGKGDGVYINTAGVGLLEFDQEIGPARVEPGDVILVNGDLGRHGIAIMAVREGLAFETEIQSDCAPLHSPVLALLEAGIQVHCLRDLTRGGLASALVEIAETAGRSIQIDQAAIPVADEVQGACELLGLDPLYVANEGRFVAFVAPADAERALALLRRYAPSLPACAIGRVIAPSEPLVTIRSIIGTWRIVDRLSGEQLPRIC
ncbi:MAG: hydrogenase expression/formation protein HypE [Verrucomicrobia bacterium]|nr:hydrogenase expression/formation protein HypE [Verrucomicrobiota bacterium]